MCRVAILLSLLAACITPLDVVEVGVLAADGCGAHGCNDEVSARDVEAAPEEPDPRPPPLPSGFFCAADPDRAGAAICARSFARCGALRAQLVDKGAAPGPCAETAAAVCFTAAKADQATEFELCFPTRESCAAQRARKASRDDYGQVGDCRDAI